MKFRKLAQERVALNSVGICHREKGGKDFLTGHSTGAVISSWGPAPIQQPPKSTVAYVRSKFILLPIKEIQRVSSKADELVPPRLPWVFLFYLVSTWLPPSGLSQEPRW